MQTRQSAALAVDAACLLIGRRPVVRVARFLLNQARHDGPNLASRNGEYALQRWVLDASPASAKLTVVDVGANVGEWSRTMLREAGRHGRADDLILHAFEPASDTCAVLRQRLPTTVLVNQVAVSASEGQTTLHLAGAKAGTNSLHSHSSRAATGTETVATTTIDDYLCRLDISRLDLLKVDTEGHDFSVLLGAEQSFRRGRIGVVQFEYNHRWVHARHFLKDVFDLLQPMDYQVGKLTRRGVEPYPGWDPDLETFIEGNYVAYTREMAGRLPTVIWWKDRQTPNGRRSDTGVDRS